MDLTATIEPKSDQLNADDLIPGAITVTITKVTAGSAEQPVSIHLAERPGRPYKPSKSMRRVLVTAWGPQADAYTGRRLTLVRNPSIKFGGDVVGGIEISHLSDIPKRMTVALTVTRGKKRTFTVEPLPKTAEATFTIPDLKTRGELRAHYLDRQKDNASKQELDAISAAANALPDDNAPTTQEN